MPSMLSTTIKLAPNYTTAINALVRFVGKEELDINLITLDFLEQFKAFLIGERDARTKKLMQQGKRVTSNRTLSLYLVSIKKVRSMKPNVSSIRRTRTLFLFLTHPLKTSRYLNRKLHVREPFQQTSLKRCGSCLIKT